MLIGKVEKLQVEEKSAVIWKYLVIDDKTFPVKDIITPTTVKRLFYGRINALDAGDGVRVRLKEFEDINLTDTKEIKHNLGCLPVVEMKNKQTWVPPYIDHWNWKPFLATWWPIQGAIKHFHHLMKQQWKNVVLSKPKIIGKISPAVRGELNLGGDYQPFKSDMIVDVHALGVSGVAQQGLAIMQGDPKLGEFVSAIKEILGLIFICAGLPPMDDKDAYKNISEIYANQQHSTEAIGMMKQLEVDQWTRVFEKVAKIGERLKDSSDYVPPIKKLVLGKSSLA